MFTLLTNKAAKSDYHVLDEEGYASRNGSWTSIFHIVAADHEQLADQIKRASCELLRFVGAWAELILVT